MRTLHARGGVRHLVAPLLAVLGLLAGCAAGSTTAAPVAAGAVAPGVQGAVAAVAPPYPFGQVQAAAPAVTGGKVPVVRTVGVGGRPYVFLTIDDGAVRDPDALRLMRDSGVRPVLFLNEMYVKGHEQYFKDLLSQTGATLGNHTVDHPNLKGKPYAFQRQEICGDADALATALGVRPVLFRPPFGSYDDTTLKAAADCGMRVEVLWSAAVNNGVVQFQKGNHLVAGDVVLMHFRKTFTADFTAFVDRARQDGLTPVPLADFLG